MLSYAPLLLLLAATVGADSPSQSSVLHASGALTPADTLEVAAARHLHLQALDAAADEEDTDAARAAFWEDELLAGAEDEETARGYISCHGFCLRRRCRSAKCARCRVCRRFGKK